jgi:ABC-type Na+ efflux pump permease subunit
VTAVSTCLTSAAQLSATGAAAIAAGSMGVRPVYALSGLMLLLPLAYRCSRR